MEIIFSPFMFSDGFMNVTVNGVGALHTRIDHADKLKYFSFASAEEEKREEFFYFCK